MSRRTNYHYDDLEDEDDSVAELHSKVKLLKTVSIQSVPSCYIMEIRRKLLIPSIHLK